MLLLLLLVTGNVHITVLLCYEFNFYEIFQVINYTP